MARRTQPLTTSEAPDDGAGPGASEASAGAAPASTGGVPLTEEAYRAIGDERVRAMDEERERREMTERARRDAVLEAERAQSLRFSEGMKSAADYSPPSGTPSGSDADLKSLADEQRRDLSTGGEGKVDTDQDVSHSIADPKATPVDYERETLRRPGQRIVPPGEATAIKAAPPIVNLPYGSEPRNIDTSTGMPVKAPNDDPETVHGDDQDADVDQGASAKVRSFRV